MIAARSVGCGTVVSVLTTLSSDRSLIARSHGSISRLSQPSPGLLESASVLAPWRPKTAMVALDTVIRWSTEISPAAATAGLELTYEFVRRNPLSIMRPVPDEPGAVPLETHTEIWAWSVFDHATGFLQGRSAGVPAPPGAPALWRGLRAAVLISEVVQSCGPQWSGPDRAELERVSGEICDWLRATQRAYAMEPTATGRVSSVGMLDTGLIDDLGIDVVSASVLDMAKVDMPPRIAAWRRARALVRLGYRRAAVTAMCELQRELFLYEPADLLLALASKHLYGDLVLGEHRRRDEGLPDEEIICALLSGQEPDGNPRRFATAA